MAAAPTTRELVEKLVAFDTTSRDSNLHLIRFVEGWLAEAGVRSELIYDATGAKANLFATIGPEVDGGVVLSGHTDVVPVDGQDWSSEPFRCVARDGRLYGRGTSDMKRSEEHTSELQSLMRISYAVLCLKKKNNNNNHQ